ncbi:MAG: tRNA pseudouridine synthase B [Candidatus Magasanikbacteria bacterium GW2011_GWC2_40_17]|nr:MAG: tRNA pseudouridine synthase B [Candidatus Magasanikbacteria bacterium GW2011_GWC2_40_17]
MPITYGFILIDKPAGITSHDVIDRLRRLTGIKRIGHAGTLDPLATGLLIVAVSREATRDLNQLVKMDKTYEAVFYLGQETDTYDAEGKITKTYEGPVISEGELAQALTFFVGQQQQIPSMYSAKKVGGKKLYQLARQDKIIERQPNTITISNLEILNYHWPELSLRITCSSGTYIRSLAFDLGRALGCGAHMSALRRTTIGDYNITKAVKLESLTADNWTHYLFQLN